MKLKLITPTLSIIFGFLICQSSTAALNKDKAIIVAPLCYNKNRIYLTAGTKKTAMRFQWSDDEFEKAKEYLGKILLVLPDLNKRTDTCPNNDRLMASIGFIGVGQALKKWESMIPPDFKVDQTQLTPDGESVMFMFPENNEVTLKKMVYLYAFLKEYESDLR